MTGSDTLPTNPSVDDVREARVAVMSTPACPYCKRAKEALTTAQVPFVDVNVGADDALRQMVRDITGKRTVPQIFVAGSSIGGSDDLLAALADGSFNQHLAAAAAEGAAAVPPELLAAIQGARQRAAEAEAAAAAAAAAAATDSGSGSTSPAQRLHELASRMAQSPCQGGIPRDQHNVRSRAFRAFTPHQLISWLAAAGEADPGVVAQQLLEANIVAVPSAAAGTGSAEDMERAAVAAFRTAGSGAAGTGSCGGGEAGGVLLTLAVEAPGPEQGEALNGQYRWQGPARPATEVANSLRHLILELYDKHLSADGRSVSYGAIRADPQFAQFVAATAELQKVDLKPLNRAELLSFGINLYNALIIHALVALGLTRMTAVQRASFYSRIAKYNIGGYDYSADDLENGMLRGNRAAASNLFNVIGLHGLAGARFRKDDPRAAKVVTPVDARIHFALVCGAKSCPPIKLYTPDNLEEGLAAAAEAFCTTEVTVDRPRLHVELSKIFKWYAVDFGSNKLERLSYIAGFLTGPANSDLVALVQEARSGRGHVRVSYKEYDWSLNGTD